MGKRNSKCVPPYAKPTLECVYPGQINMSKGQEKNKRVHDIAQESL